MSSKFTLHTVIFTFALLVFSGFAIAADGPEGADQLFKLRQSTPMFGKAMLEYERYYSKHDIDFDHALFLSKAYFHYANRYGKNNPKKAIRNYGLSIKWANRALGMNPADYDAAFFKTVSLMEAGSLKTKIERTESIKTAKEAFEAMIAKSPDSLPAYRALGRLYRIAPEWPVGYRDLEKSESYLRKALQMKEDDPESLLDLGRTLIRNGKYSEARQTLIKVGSMKGPEGWEIETDLTKQDALKELESIRGKL